MVYDEDPSGATQIYNPDDPMVGGEWSVNISDDETRTMTGAEVAMEFLRGALDNEDTYVWREGMGDWIPLGECAELQEVIKRYDIGQKPPPPAEADEEDDFGSTVMMDHNAPLPGAGPKVDEVSRTMASPVSAYGAASPSPAGPSPGGFGASPGGFGAPPAAYPSEPAREADPFAAARPATSSSPSVPPGGRRVGERNEASALFDINDLHAAAAARARPKPAFEDKKSDIDDLLNLGGGLSGGIASAFAPPPIHAPAPPPPPKPEPAVAAAQPMSSALLAAQLEPPKKSRLGIIIGAAAGVLLLTGAVVAFMLSGSSEESTAKNTATSAEAKDKDGKADEDKAGDDKDDEGDDKTAKSDDTEEDKKDDKADDKADDKTASDDKTAQSKTATKDDKATATKDDKATATKDDKKDAPPADDKKDAPAEDKKDDKAKPAAEFNRDAARSALTAAAGAASGCKTKDGPTGKGQVTVTFAPSGRATTATVGPPFAGTSVGSCAAAAFKSASVPPFTGSAVTVAKSFFIK